jgi:hypothetical protein
VLGPVIRPLLGDLEGAVVSPGALLAQGAFEEEDAAPDAGTLALRRLLVGSRVRETLIISRDTDAQRAPEV